MKLRTHGCVALGTAGNWQGSTKCFDLDTGKVVLRRIIGEALPSPDLVIKRVISGERQHVAKSTRTILCSVIVNVNRSIGKMKS